METNYRQNLLAARSAVTVWLFMQAKIQSDSITYFDDFIGEGDSTWLGRPKVIQ